LDWTRHKNDPVALRRGVAVATAAIAFALLFPVKVSAAPPTVKATWATEVTATSFRARAVLNTGNLNTTYRFDYITLAAYEANVQAGAPAFQGALRIPAGNETKVLATSEDVEVANRIAGLSADTSYRYRLVAKNANGEAVGPERSVRTQEASPSQGLAEGRGWELVSPLDKNGGGIAAPETLFGGGALQAAQQGDMVTYGSASSFGEAAGAPGASQYVSVRTAAGWSTRNVTLSTEAGAFGPEPDGAPYRFFSTDLAQALVLTNPHAYQRLALGPPLATLAALATPDLRFAGARSDLDSVAFSTCAALTPEATEVPAIGGGCDPAAPNLYLLTQSDLRLINFEPGNTVGTPKAALAAQAGAISTDGSRVYWLDLAGSLLLRDGNRTLLLDPEGEFQIASEDGSVAYFTKAGHLHRYTLATESATDLTPGGGVVGVLGASADGSYAYYVDGSGVELWHAGATTQVAAAADPSNYPPATGTARVSADGTRLAFLSSAVLTDYDNNGMTELYRYDASTDSLLCASCNPTGARPLGPSSIPGAIANGTEVRLYKPRAMNAQGTRLFFESEDSLVPKDSNGHRDVYEWWAPGVGGCARANGCVGLISGGKSVENSTFVDASSDGANVFFLAPDSLVSSDPGSFDLYDARIGGGFPDPPVPIPCFGDACQPLPPEPDDPTPGTLFYGSEANPKLRFEKQGGKRKPKGKRKHRKHHKRHGHRSGRARGR
jgi:hypothetical protein